MPSDQTTAFIHPSSVVDEGASIGTGTKVWHFCHISRGATIGRNCVLGQNVFVGGRAVIGHHVKIQNNVSVYDGVALENYVFCGPSMVFINDINPRAKYPKYGKYKPTLVKEGTSIGANATIICGITIGRHAFIGSGSVVTKDVPDYALVYGVPAELKGWICECGTKLDFADKDSSRCNRCKREYVKNDMIVKRVNQ